MTNKQILFIAEYMKDFNATQAAIRAGYSPKTAYSIGQELLKKPEIAEEIKRQIEERIMKADEISIRLADIARGNIADLMDITTTGYNFKLLVDGEDGKIVNPNTKLIRKIKQKVTTHIGKKEDSDDTEIIETELELYNAQDALQFLAKMNGMITEKIDMTSKGEKIVPDENYNRAVSTLADALGKIISGQGAEENGAVVSPE